jgi:F-type H+-transporting ATPase subunit a
MTRVTVFPETLIKLGPVSISDTVVTTWIVMAGIVLLCWLMTRRLALKPSLVQEIIEALFEATEKTVREILPVEPWLAVPVIGTFWVLIGAANLAGLIPGLTTPTADLNTTCALAAVSFSMTHIIGIRTQGLKGYLAHYRDPSWILLPFHLIAEATRTVALAIRLFGNMLSGDMIAVILLGVVGFIVPVPFALLHVVIGLIQAYIFGVLTLVFIAGGIRTGKPGESG